jgi:integrase
MARRNNLPTYVKPEFRGEHVYYYFRRRSYPRVLLPGLPYSPEFMEAYHRALAGSRVEIAASRTVPGTVNDVIVKLYGSLMFSEGKNGPRRGITKQTDRNLLEAFRQRHGEKRIGTLEHQHLVVMLAEKKGAAARRNLLRVLRLLLAFAVEQKLRKDNPAAAIKLGKIDTTGFHTWTEEELQQYERRHPVGTKAHLALGLLLYTVVRRQDVVLLGPPHEHKGRLQFNAHKDRKDSSPIDIPIAPPLAAIIAASKMVGTKTYLVTDYGLPFTANGFGGKMRAWCDEAGLPQCSAHGLRKAGMRRMAEAGCSEDFIASISGHKDMRIIRQYVRAANRARMADDAMAKTLAKFPAGNGN